MELGTFLLLSAFAYGIGIFWYDLLPGKLAERPWRVAAYPFVGIVLAEAMTRGDFVSSATRPSPRAPRSVPPRGRPLSPASRRSRDGASSSPSRARWCRPAASR